MPPDRERSPSHARHTQRTGAELKERFQTLGWGVDRFMRETGLTRHRAADFFAGRADGDIPLWVETLLVALERVAALEAEANARLLDRGEGVAN